MGGRGEVANKSQACSSEDRWLRYYHFFLSSFPSLDCFLNVELKGTMGYTCTAIYVSWELINRPMFKNERRKSANEKDWMTGELGGEQND